MKRSRPTLALLALTLSFVLPLLLLAKEFALPKLEHARHYAAHDEHAKEKMTLAAEPYDTREKVKIFKTDYLKHDLLPILIVASNDGDAAVRVTRMRVELVTRDRAKATPIDEDELTRRLANTRQMSDRSSGIARLPIPLGRDHAIVPRGATDEFLAASFNVRTINAKSTAGGFYFFDTGDLEDPVRGATLYISGVKDGAGQEMMFFEIPLDKYLETKQTTY